MASDIDPEELIRRLVEAVPGGVVHVDPAGAVLRANPAGTAFLGFSYDELTQRYTQDFDGDTWFEDGRPCGPEHYPVTQTLTTGLPSGPTTIGVRQPSGEIRWAVFRAVPVEGGGAVVTFLDITERRVAERRLRISDRLASLGRLAAGVAHEVNNPLTWVMLNLERALEEEAPRESIGRALSGLERVASIVRDLGAFARVDDAEPEPFDVHDAIEHAAAIARAQIQHRAVLEIAPDPVPRAYGLASRTVQIVLNLLLNAAQAIEPGQRTRNRIAVRTFVEPGTHARDAGQVVIEVEDTGVGMHPTVLEHAIDPFFTTKEPGEGTGLGLAISHALAAAMQGSLELSSVPGEGTRVRLRLPVAADPSVAPAPEPARRSSPERARILVCDDEPEILSILVWALRPHDVEVVGSGREALARLETEDFAAVVCDLMMPEVTGMAVYEHLQRVRPELAERMLFVTGGAYTEAARAFVDRSDITCIMKPFRVTEVREQVDRILEARASAS
ncbi:MAG: ATP-binding protein [Myxococcota bacterium]